MDIYTRVSHLTGGLGDERAYQYEENTQRECRHLGSAGRRPLRGGRLRVCVHACERAYQYEENTQATRASGAHKHES